MRLVTFAELPMHDTTWSLISGPDGNAYAAACCEHTGGIAAVIVRYRANATREALLDIGDATGQPADNGRATQCKIHYSMVVDQDGILYGASHLSGPPLGHLTYNPWGNWADPRVSFPGAGLVVYDTRTDQLLWSDFLYPQEGCRCLALDRTRRRLYSCTYPLNHFHAYDLATRTDHDFGRIGAVNPQAVWLDLYDRPYTTDDFGRILRLDPDRERLETLDVKLPHPPFQNGWHDIVYDAAPCLEPGKVLGVAWNAWPHFWLYDMTEGDQGRMYDLGPVHRGLTGLEPNQINQSHVGGLAFGPDNLLYYSVMCEQHPRHGMVSHLKRFNPHTGEEEDLGPIRDPVSDEWVWYISRAIWISRRDLILAVVGRTPTGIVHVRFGEEELEDAAGPEFPMLRFWG
ncbi:MAG: hypothetical protein QHJ73_15550 [Armatimonadota bacterium]|nr:hypothetical protein [Armatimonadota bacterium]